MHRLKDVRDLLLIACSDGLLSDEELLLLLEENTSKNPRFSYENYERLPVCFNDLN